MRAFNPRVQLTGPVPYFSKLPAKVLKAIRRTPSSFTPGLGSCPGCGGMQALQTVSRTINYVAEQVGANAVIQSQQTGCIEVITSTGDMSAVADQSGKDQVRSYLHSTFSGGTSQLQGMFAAYRSFLSQGKMDAPILFWGFSGDGGGLDIGMADFSSFLASRTRALYVIYDNRGFMNTGAQTSSTTLLGEHRTTSPNGSAIVGQTTFPKDPLRIAAAHDTVYSASATMANVRDLMRKTIIALMTNGPTLLHIDASCPREWKHPANQSVAISQTALSTGVFRLAEVVEGKWLMSAERKQDESGAFNPIDEYLGSQGHLRHLLQRKNADILAMNQAHVDAKWAELESEVQRTAELELTEHKIPDIFTEFRQRFARGEI